MGYTIAIAGKGGTGKTTVAAFIVRLIKEKKMGSILAVDADPNSNLGENLGLKVKEDVGKIIDDIAAHPQDIPCGISKDRFIEYQVQTSIQEGEGFDLLAMGKPEGAGCYCYANNVLRNIIEKLVKDYDYIVIDNGAGFEHLSRRTTRSADALVVVSDATVIGLRCAQRIDVLTKELGIKIKKRLLIINRQNQSPAEETIGGVGLEHIGSIPQDSQVQEASLKGISLLDLSNDAPSLSAMRRIGEKIWN